MSKKEAIQKIMYKSPAFQWYVKDYLSDHNVQLMTMEEQGAYVRLINHEWLTQGKLTTDEKELAVLSGLGKKWDKESGKKIKKCFRKKGKYFYHPRLKKEREKQKKHRENSAKGGRKYKPSENKGKKSKPTSDSLASESEVKHKQKGTLLFASSSSSSSSSKKEVNNKHLCGLKNGFDEFWKIYPKKKAKGQARKTWNKIKPNEQLLATIVATIERAKTSVEWTKDNGQFIPHPATWLNAEGWEDEYTPDNDTEATQQRAERIKREAANDA